MSYKNLLIIIFIITCGCSTYTITNNEKKTITRNSFINKGFALVYSDSLYQQKIISKKIDKRSLLIFQKNLKKGTTVKIKNILNDKTIIARVGEKSKYPLFNNSVITERISKEIDLNLNEPYIEIFEILDNSTFIAKKTKIFEEEINVADKAPIDSISINNLNDTDKNVKKVKKVKFNYIIKIADFYFEDTAKSMIDRIKKETTISKVKVKNLSDTKYRVFLGPFTNINSLQKAFNDINILNFENIEVIKK